MKEILKVIKPGDVINQRGRPKFYEIHLWIAYFGIWWHQRRLFGRKSNWKDTHSMLFFNDQNTFSVELPEATMKPLKKYYKSEMSIYRFKKFELTPVDISLMKKTADEMVGENYDIGQLLDIAINSILGYAQIRKLKIFDFGRKKKVCSVGVRVLLEKLNKIKNPDSKIKLLFAILNGKKWNKKYIKKFKGTDVEMTSPAHFANSDFFQDEFELIAKFKNGKRIS